jgi:hypothetical protein
MIPPWVLTQMGGLACVVACYLEANEPERCNVFKQAVTNITAKDLKVGVEPIAEPFSSCC